MIEIHQIEQRKKELSAQLQAIHAQIGEAEQHLSDLRHRQIATQGAIAALDEMLNEDTVYSKPSLERSPVDAAEV